MEPPWNVPEEQMGKVRSPSTAPSPVGPSSLGVPAGSPPPQGSRAPVYDLQAASMGVPSDPIPNERVITTDPVGKTENEAKHDLNFWETIPEMIGGGVAYSAGSSFAKKLLLKQGAKMAAGVGASLVTGPVAPFVSAAIAMGLAATTIHDIVKYVKYGEDAFKDEEGNFTLDPSVKEFVENVAWGGGAVLGLKALGPTLKGIQRGSKAIGITAALQTPGKLIGEYVSEPVWKMLVKGANRGLFNTKEKIVRNGKLVDFKVKKSLADIFEPAIDRLSPNMKQLFRDESAIKANITTWGSQLGNRIKDLDPGERFLAEKILRGAKMPSTVSPELKELVKEFRTGFKKMGVDAVHQRDVMDSIGTQLTKGFQAPADVFTSKTMQGTLNKIMAKPGKLQTKFMATQSVIRKQLENPAISGDLRAVLNDLHDLPSTLPEMIAKASKQATFSNLKARLLSEAGTVVDEATMLRNPKKYLPSLTFTQGKNSQYVLRDVELELRAMKDIPKISHSFFNKIMVPWKQWKVMPRPAAWTRNLISNIGLNHMGTEAAEGLPFWRMDVYKHAFTDLKKNAPAFREFNNITGQGGTFSINEVLSQEEGLKLGANMFDYALSLNSRMMAPAKEFYNLQETWAKYAKYLFNLEQGMSKKDAAWEAVESTFNYGEITRATARLRSTIMPFATWQTKILPRVAGAIVRNPVKAVSLMAMYHEVQDMNMNAIGMSDQEAEDFRAVLPEYVRKGMFFILPWRDASNRIQYLDMTYMIPGFGDAVEMGNNPMARIFSTPLIGVPAALLNNKKYSGAPIYFDWESPMSKLWKSTKYVWEQAVPSSPLVPGSTDWNTLARSMKNMLAEEGYENPNAQSMGQAVASISGFKIKPVDQELAYQKSQGLENIRKSEIAIEMKRAIKNASSQEEVDEIVASYQDRLDELLGAGEYNTTEE